MADLLTYINFTKHPYSQYFNVGPWLSGYGRSIPPARHHYILHGASPGRVFVRFSEKKMILLVRK